MPKGSMLALLTLLVLFAQSSMAAPVELADHGVTETALLGDTSVLESHSKALPSANSVQRSIKRHQYPVVTRSMSASGRHATVHRGHAGTGNVFLVGTDFYSTSWLRKNYSQLKQLGAQGIVVNVPSAIAFAQLKALAGDLPLIAASVDDLAKQLNLKHYPVLITESKR